MHDKQFFLFFEFFNRFNLLSQVVHSSLEPKFVIFGSLESKKPHNKKKLQDLKINLKSI
jgi:hypothetical protein